MNICLSFVVGTETNLVLILFFLLFLLVLLLIIVMHIIVNTVIMMTVLVVRTTDSEGLGKSGLQHLLSDQKCAWRSCQVRRFSRFRIRLRAAPLTS